MGNESRKTILIVEDEPLLALSGKIALENRGYAAVTASTGEKAIEILRGNNAIDIVLLDINLGSGIDGVEAAEIILNEKDIPVVFLSSHAESEIFEKTEKIAAYGYVMKNSNIAILDANIKMAIKQFETNRGLRNRLKAMEALKANSAHDHMKASETDDAVTIEKDTERRLNGFREKEEWTKAILDSILSGVVVIEADTRRIVEVNDKAAACIGLPKESIVGCVCHQFICPADVNSCPVLDLGAQVDLSEKHLLTAQGKRIDIIKSVIPVMFHGHRYLMESFVDIRDQKVSEETIKSLLSEKELILKEVHHRVKNTLNIISSLFTLQAGTMKDSSAIESLEDARSRVQSIMVLYTKLFEAIDFSEISVSNYLPDLVDKIVLNFPRSAPIKIGKRIDDFVLNAKVLQPLGIIVNELLTNAMKYAFDDRVGDTIFVSAALRDNRVTIAVQDNGRGLPESISLENTSGFGLTLVKLLSEQMEGSLRMERESGTKFVLEFGI